MSNIINFPQKDCDEGNGYTTGDGLIGSINHHTGLELVCPGGTPVLMCDDFSVSFESRMDAAKWFHQCAIMLDSKELWKNGEYVGMDYPEVMPKDS